MREFLPYLALLKPVKWTFLGAVISAIVFGVVSGFGLPFMARQVFPVIFPEQPDSSAFATRTESGYQDVFFGEFAEVREPVFRQDNGSFTRLREGVFIGRDGALYTGRAPEALQPAAPPLYLQRPGGQGYELLQGGLYEVDPLTGEYNRLESRDFQRPSLWLVLGAVSLLPLVMLVRGLSGFINIYLINRCGMHVLEAVRMQVFHKLQLLPLAFFKKQKTGDLVSRVLGDTNVVANTAVQVANDLVKQPVTLLGAVGYLIYQSFLQREALFVLLCFAVIGLCIFPIRYVGKKLLKKAYAMQEQQGTVHAVLNENLMGARDVRAYNLQEREEDRFRHSQKLFQKLHLKVVKYNAGLTPMVEVLTAIGIAGATLYAARQGVALTEILPLIFALYLSYEPIKKIGNIYNDTKKGLGSVARINYILDEPETIRDPAEPVPFPRPVAQIRYENVQFSYADVPALAGISLTVNAGEVLALVGPSGAGKTTFVNLLPRFYDVQSGAIRVNGTDIRHFARRDLRDHIGIVSQDVTLFNDTVENNIRVGRPRATSHEVRDAARAASASGFIEHLPHGYDTPIGEYGGRLSGGQRQRLALARAFLKNAPILILDEATSALDSESEAHIQEALQRLTRGKTTFIVAHRFSTLKLASRILVFHNGRIAGDGSHEPLMETCPVYRDLYRRQQL